MTFTVEGTGFIDADGDLPTVSVGTTSYPADAVDGCTPVADAPDGYETCTSLTFTVPEEGLDPGSYEVVVTNPPPVGCSSTDALDLVVVGAPDVTAIEPPIACATGLPTDLTLVGTGFLVVDGTYPTVTIDDAPAAVVEADGCTDITGLVEAVRTCTSLVVAFPAAAGTVGAHVVRVVNPPPADCAAEDVEFDVALPPDVTGVVPGRVCSVEFTVTVSGHNFVPGSRVSLGTTPAASTRYVSESELEADFLPLAPGTYDLTVSNGAGCEDTLPDAVTVVENPVVFFVDPPVVYNGINLQATIYASGVVGAVTTVTITPSGGGAPIALAFTFDPAHPNRILATVPAGTAAGAYDVSVTTDIGCSATLAGGLAITDTLTLALEAIEPPFGWTAGSTAVRLAATDPPPLGEEGFAATPRAYLNPAAAGALATPMRSVVFVDAAQLTAVVPSGMAAGTYDVIVVNPEGAVGGRGAGGVLAGVLPASAAFAQDAATAAPVEPATEGTTEAAPAEGEDEAGEEAVPAAAPEVASEETASAGGIGLSFGVRAQVGFAQVFGDLGVAPAGEIEIGYRLPFLGRRLGVFVAGGYQYTYGSGSGADDGLTAEDGTPYPGGYSWSLDEHAVTVTLGLFGRLFADADAFSPYLWAGPRVYLLETAIDAGAGGSSFGENTETSTEFGVGGGVGVEWVLGPGPLFAEVEVGWSPLEHEITGGSSSGQLGLAFGYRVLL